MIPGNAVHAVLHASALPIVAAAVAIVPPIALLAAVHGVTVLLRAHTRSGWMHLLATTMTVLIAAATFRLSFTALRDLAVLAAIPTKEAWMWPIIIEGSMAQATVALLALAHSGTTRAHATTARPRLTKPAAAPAPSDRDRNSVETEVARAQCFP